MKRHTEADAGEEDAQRESSAAILNAVPEKLYPRLLLTRNRAEPVPCFVNPADPTDATLNRDFSYALSADEITVGLFAMFLSVVVTQIMLTQYSRRRAKRILQRKYPKEPWCWDKQWVNRRLCVRGVTENVVAMPGSVVVILSASLYFMFVPALWREVGIEFLESGVLALLMLAGGIACGAGGVRDWYSKRAFCGCYVELSELSARLGALLNGVLMWPGHNSAPERIEAILECVRLTWYTGNGTASGGWDRRVLFKHEELVDRDSAWQDGEWVRYELTIPVPSTQPSSEETHDLKTGWFLTLNLPCAFRIM